MIDLVPGGEVRVVLTTCPDESSASRLARTLVEERLAACGNVVPGLRSIYRWEGEVRDDPEALLVLKVATSGLAELADRLVALHPYDVPELVALPVERGTAAYLEWVVEETRGEP